MKLVLLSDIHSNLQALEKVLTQPFVRSADKVICLGDQVGYGANPVEVTARIRALASTVILGNHDEACIKPELTAYFSRDAMLAAQWTRGNLSVETLEWLGTLPRIVREGDLTLVHADPQDPAGYDYILYAAQAQSRLHGPAKEIVFYGHTHWMGIFPAQGLSIYPNPGETYRLDPAMGPHLVNIGSIGQPRDGDPRSGCVTFDTATREVVFHRVVYDHRTAARRILDAGLPRRLADRLAEGK